MSIINDPNTLFLPNQMIFITSTIGGTSRATFGIIPSGKISQYIPFYGTDCCGIVTAQTILKNPLN